MFNFSDFCKVKECPNYTERNHSAGTWRYCELIGTAFYVMERPENCPHRDEIDALAEYEKEKANAWKKLTTKQTTKPKTKFSPRITDEQINELLKKLTP